jgi:riboflavin synthase
MMFTGIVEELAEVTAVRYGSESATLSVRAPLVSSDAIAGSSIAVNGVCLTVVGCEDCVVGFDVMAETLRRTSLGAVGPSALVNLERAVAVTDRLGGHIVQGHVDGTARLVSRTPGDRWEVVRITLPAALSRYVVEKGSICVDGVSLTVSALGADTFEVSLIPTTLARTTLGRVAVGDPVNLEVDVIGKYVERLLTVAPVGAIR